MFSIVELDADGKMLRHWHETDDMFAEYLFTHGETEESVNFLWNFPKETFEPYLFTAKSGRMFSIIDYKF